MRKLQIFLGVFALTSGFLMASLFLYDAKKELRGVNNPTDPNAESYQGYRTTDAEQSTVLLNDASLRLGEDDKASFSNAGIKPTSYRISTDPTFPGAPWIEMPASRCFSFPLAAAASNQTVHVQYRIRNDLIKVNRVLVNINHPPVLRSFTSLVSNLVTNRSTSLRVSCYDPDGDTPRVTFTILGTNQGTLSGLDTTNGKTFTASTSTGVVTLRVNVAKATGPSTNGYLSLVVNSYPIIDVTPGSIATNDFFTATLATTKEKGYWSTNAGASWASFGLEGTNLLITRSANLMTYGKDVINGESSPTNLTIYTITNNYPTVTAFPSSLITNFAFVATLSTTRERAYWSTNGGSVWTSFGIEGTSLSITQNTTLMYYGIDQVTGNFSPTNLRTYSFSFDITPPILSASPASGTIATGSTLPMTITINKGLGFVSTNGPNGPFSSFTGSTNFSVVNASNLVSFFGQNILGYISVTNTYASIIPNLSRTLAGSSLPQYADGIGTSASFNAPTGVAVDASGNVYVADRTNHRIRKIDRFGVTTTVAGSGVAGFQNGSGSGASFNNPTGVAVDSNGNLYVADSLNHRIRKITPAGMTTTFAGSGIAGLAEGTGEGASFNTPWGVAVDLQGNVIIADRNNSRLRRIAPDGTTTTLVGTDDPLAVEGTGESAKLWNPTGVAVDKSGYIYVSQSWPGGGNIRKISPWNVTESLPDLSLNLPNGVAVDRNGEVYVADSGNHRILKISGSGVVTTLGGTNTRGTTEGSGIFSKFNFPSGLCVDDKGLVIVADTGNHLIRTITPSGQSPTVWPSLPGGTIANAPTNLTLTITNGNGYFSTVSSNGPFVTFSNSYEISVPINTTFWTYGDDSNGFSSPIKQFSYQIDTISPVLTASHQDQYYSAEPFYYSLTPSENFGYFRTNFDPKWTRFSQSGTAIYIQKPVTLWQFTQDLAGNTTITNQVNLGVGTWITSDIPENFHTNYFTSMNLTLSANRSGSTNFLSTDNGSTWGIFFSNTNLSITDTFAYFGKDSFGQTTQTNWRSHFLHGMTQEFSHLSNGMPQDMTMDSKGNLLVAMGWQVLKISTNGEINTIAGNDNRERINGNGTNASFTFLRGICVDSNDTIYVSESYFGSVIRKITTNGDVSTLAGSGSFGSRDGQGTNADFDNPGGLAADAFGNVFVADRFNNKIRKISPSGEVTTFAGAGVYGILDGAGSTAKFANPTGLTFDSNGILFVSDNGNNRIRRISQEGNVTTFAGSDAGFAEGIGTEAKFNGPNGISFDSKGNLIVADFGNNRIRKIDSNGSTSTIAGNGTLGVKNDYGILSKIGNPSRIFVEKNDRIFFIQADSQIIRVYIPD